MGGMSPGQRAAAELARDPARSDTLIAAAARCTTRTVQRQRRALERRGVIAPVPSGARQHAWPAWPSRNPGASARAVQQLALDPHRSTRDLAAAAACTPQTVRVALAALRPDQGHTDGMGKRLEDRLRSRVIVKPDDPHALPSMTDPHNREPARYAEPPDPIEEACPACTLEWRDGGWRHERSCVMRRAG
jgi:hypothetical protein